MNGITVKELIEILNKYDENYKVWVSGGEDAHGEFGELCVELENDYETIMEF